MVDVLTEIEIARPRDAVAAFAADPANATAWYKNIKSVEWVTPPPVAVGSRMRFLARFLGRTLDYTYEVREHDPGRRFVMSTAQPRRAVRVREGLRPADGARDAPGQRGRPAPAQAGPGGLSSSSSCRRVAAHWRSIA